MVRYVRRPRECVRGSEAESEGQVASPVAHHPHSEAGEVLGTVEPPDEEAAIQKAIDVFGSPTATSRGVVDRRLVAQISNLRSE